MRDYLLIDQYRVSVEHRYREGQDWHSRTYRSCGDIFVLAGVPVEFAVDAAYELVDP